MEYIEAYDEEKNYLGKFSRDEVHARGLWHNTVHCWLYNKKGDIYFQIRKDAGKYYTKASGHVLAGEFGYQSIIREIKEELGININLPEIIKPEDFENVKNKNIIYKGYLKNYNYRLAKLYENQVAC